MKRTVFGILLAASGAFALGPLPNGNYSGAGHCASQNGESFAYNVELDVSDTKLVTTYHSEQGDVSDAKQFTFLRNGFFSFVSKEGKGEGYCGNTSCHYEATIDGKPGEDTFFVDGKTLRLLGSLSVQGMKFSCEDEYKPAVSSVD